MRPLNGPDDITRALTAVGELLAADGESYAIVVLGGAALNQVVIHVREKRDAAHE